MNRIPVPVALAAGTSALALSACIAVIGVEPDELQLDHDHTHVHSQGHDGFARATLRATSGSELEGYATFEAREGGVQVSLSVEDVEPGWHAVHIHELGDCSADDGSSAGGHFNPDGHAHGAPHAPEHHAGDLGNMWVDEDGNGYHSIFMPRLAIDGGPFGVVGRALVVHAGADDLSSQPSGAAGSRIGCGEIR
ncbi:MAG: superoxide dismutase family protein [Planctomycetota bacterium]